MGAANPEQQLVAVIALIGRGQCDYPRLWARAAEVGFHDDGAFSVRLNRVALEILLREHLTSREQRERVLPPLLAERVLLSWWHSQVSAALTRESCAYLAADPEVSCAVVVPYLVKTWAMNALTR